MTINIPVNTVIFFSVVNQISSFQIIQLSQIDPQAFTIDTSSMQPYNNFFNQMSY